MTRPDDPKSVPKRMLPIHGKVVAVTDDVCERHLGPKRRCGPGTRRSVGLDYAVGTLLCEVRNHGELPGVD